MPRPWYLRIGDILKAIERIEKYTEGMSRTAFEDDPRTRDATFYNMQIIGEAASHIPPEVTKRYPDIPWIDIRGMRNVIAHGYFAVKLPIVWKTVADELPQLKSAMQEIQRTETKE